MSAEAARAVAATTAAEWAATGRPTQLGKPLHEALKAWCKGQAGLRRTDERYKALERIFKPLLGKPGENLTTTDFIQCADKLSEGSRNKSLREMRAVAAWCAERDLLPPGLLQGIRIPRGANRDYVPELEDVRRYYNGCEILEDSQCRLFRWLVLSAWRKNEARNMHWDWIEGDTVIIPAEFSKDKKEHTHPLSNGLVKLLQPKHGGEGYVFQRLDGSGRVLPNHTNWAHEKVIKETGVKRFLLHDLRRAFATHMADAGGDVLAIELCLGHSPSKVLGSVGAVYNRSQRFDMRRELLNQWSETITR